MANDDSTKIAEAKAKSDAVETEQSEDEAEDKDEATKGDEKAEETSAEEESKEEAKSDDKSEDEAESEDDADEDETEDESESDFKKRFTQFKGDTPEDYLKSLEEGYANSSTEAQRLNAENRELKQKVERIATDNPEIAEKAAEKGQPLDPTAQVLRQQVEDQWKSEYDDFVKKHPEVANDDKVSEELNSALAIVRDHVWAKEGKIVGMARGLEMAYSLIGKEDDSVDSTRQAAKNVAAQGRSSGSKKVKTSSALNEDERSVAEKMGLDPTKVAKHVRRSE